jgi:hypothetical protein
MLPMIVPSASVHRVGRSLEAGSKVTNDEPQLCGDWRSAELTPSCCQCNPKRRSRLGFGSARPFRESCRDRVVAGLTEKRSAYWAQRRAYRQSSDERHATRARQERHRIVTALRLQSSDRRKVEPKLSTQGLSLSLESLHDVCAKAKLSHFQPLVADSITHKPGRLMSVA